MVHRNYHNGLKTTLLLGGMWALLLGIGALIASGTGRVVWIVVFAAIGLAQTAYSYWNSATIALRSMGAYQVAEAEQPALYAIVRELSDRAQQPMPTIWVAPTLTPNAFATGRNPNNAAVCCTEGILAILNERELRGVLGHGRRDRDGRARPPVFWRGESPRERGGGLHRLARAQSPGADRIDAHPVLTVAHPRVRRG